MTFIFRECGELTEADSVKDDQADEARPVEEKTWKDSLMYEEEGDTWPMTIFKFFFPICVWLGAIVVSYIIWGDLAIRWAGYTLAYLFPPLGKESIIPLGVADGFHPMVMALTVFMVDCCMAMIISWNYYILEKIPLIGRIFTYLKKKGAATLEKHPGLKSGAFLGIFAIVSLPFIGAGGTTSAIVGRMIGLKPYYIISAVAIGSLLSGIFYAYVAEAFIILYNENPAFGILFIILIIIGFVILFYVLRNYEKRKTAQAQEVQDE